MHNPLAVSTLLYGSKNWTIKSKDKTRITAAEMKLSKERNALGWTMKEMNTQ
jgi:hypothetical protein